MKFQQLLTSGTLLATSTFAFAGPNVGGAVGSATSEYEDVDNSTSFEVFGGYAFDNIPLAIELAYFDSGDADIDNIPLTINVSGFTATVGYDSLANNNIAQVGFTARVGLYNLDTEIEGFGGSIEESSTGLALKFGIGYRPIQELTLRFDIQGLIGVEDFANDEDITIYSLGAQFNFND